jgi:hypothetical protein
MLPRLVAGQVRGRAQPFEVGRIESGSPIERREPRVLRLPVRAFGGLSRAIAGICRHLPIPSSVRDDDPVAAFRPRR